MCNARAGHSAAVTDDAVVATGPRRGAAAAVVHLNHCPFPLQCLRHHQLERRYGWPALGRLNDYNSDDRFAAASGASVQLDTVRLAECAARETRKS
jgi:hypothetical protein